MNPIIVFEWAPTSRERGASPCGRMLEIIGCGKKVTAGPIGISRNGVWWRIYATRAGFLRQRGGASPWGRPSPPQSLQPRDLPSASDALALARQRLSPLWLCQSAGTTPARTCA